MYCNYPLAPRTVRLRTRAPHSLTHPEYVINVSTSRPRPQITRPQLGIRRVSDGSGAWDGSGVWGDAAYRTWSMSDTAVASPSPEEAPVMITVFFAPPLLPVSLSSRPACTLTAARDAAARATGRSALVLETEVRMLRRADAAGAAAAAEATTRPEAGARDARVAGRTAEATRVEVEVDARDIGARVTGWTRNCQNTFDYG
jgi:hypothetical protein